MNRYLIFIIFQEHQPTNHCHWLVGLPWKNWKQIHHKRWLVEFPWLVNTVLNQFSIPNINPQKPASKQLYNLLRIYEPLDFFLPFLHSHLSLYHCIQNQLSSFTTVTVTITPSHQALLLSVASQQWWIWYDSLSHLAAVSGDSPGASGKNENRYGLCMAKITNINLILVVYVGKNTIHRVFG